MGWMGWSGLIFIGADGKIAVCRLLPVFPFMLLLGSVRLDLFIATVKGNICGNYRTVT
jgi:hypothetical protein